MGWPNKESSDLKGFFPGHLLETGHDTALLGCADGDDVAHIDWWCIKLYLRDGP